MTASTAASGSTTPWRADTADIIAATPNRPSRRRCANWHRRNANTAGSQGREESKVSASTRRALVHPKSWLSDLLFGDLAKEITGRHNGANRRMVERYLVDKAPLVIYPGETLPDLS